MGSYSKYSLVPTDEPDKQVIGDSNGNDHDDDAGGGSAFSSFFSNQFKPTSVNRSTLPTAPLNSAFDYNSAFSYKSAFTYNSNWSNYTSAFDYGRKEQGTLSSSAPKKDKRRSGGLDDRRCDCTACMSFVLATLSYLFIALTFPFTLPFCFKKLDQWERLVVFRMGRLRGVLGPGMVFYIPWMDKLTRVDMRTKAFSVPPQQFITCDNGIVELGCEVKYRVSDVKKLTTTVTTHEHGLRNFGKTVLLNVLTKHTIKEMERDRIGLAGQVQRDLNARVLGWGIEIGSVEMSQVNVLKQPEPNDPLKPLLGALGSFAGGGAAAGGGGAASALGTAASVLSSMLSAASSSKGVATGNGNNTHIVNIPGLTEYGAPTCAQASALTGSIFEEEKKTDDQGDTDALTEVITGGSDTTPLLEPDTEEISATDSGAPSTSIGSLPQTQLGQYLHSLVQAANSADLTHGVYRLAVEGTPQGGTAVFIIFIGSGVRQVVEGDLPKVTPDVSVSINQDDLYAIFQGTLPPLQAYLSGRLTVQGSVQMLMGLQALQDVHQTLGRSKDGTFVA